jgi:hypothetical protein
MTTALEEMDRPAFTLQPSAGAQVDKLLARIEALDARVLALEIQCRKSSGLSNAINAIVAKWPGPFTAQQIRDAIIELYPGLIRMEQRSSVEGKIGRMCKAGIAVCLFQGSGPHPSIYERAAHPPPGAGRPGARLGARHNYESGFRAMVREALPELPERFTLLDLQKWIGTRYPEARIPEGSWSSTLRKLTDLGELKVVKFGHRGKSLKVYTRTSKRVAPSGAELTAVQDAWREFRSTIKTEVPEFLSGLDRAEEP